MIDVDEAKRLILEESKVLDVIDVGLAEARGRVLAEDVLADRDLPPTDRSAMDGFALRTRDVLEPDHELTVTGEIRAGEPLGTIRVGKGSCVRIMTGAIVPNGADTVVMVELTQEDPESGTVKIGGEPKEGQHIRRRGEDVRAGERILQKGSVIHAPEVAALASVGRARVKIFRPPLVGVLSTGDEVVEPEQVPREHEVRNSNAWTLLAQLDELDLEGRYLGIAHDTRQELAEGIQKGLGGDLLLITGGVSASRYDLVGEVLAAAGMRLILHQVAIRPGKPMLVGRHESCLVVGLPGNPVSTFTDFAVFVAPALRRMMGYSCWDNLEMRAVLAERLKRKPGRTSYHLAKVSPGEEGVLTAFPVRTMGSGDVVSMSRANAFVITPGGAHALEAGTRVPTLLWRDFHLR